MNSPEQPSSGSEAWFDALDWEERKKYMRLYRRYYRERKLRVARGLAANVLNWSEWLEQRLSPEDTE